MNNKPIAKIKNWSLYEHRQSGGNSSQFSIEGQFKNHPEVIIPFVSLQWNRENLYDIFPQLYSPYEQVKLIPKYAREPFIKAIQQANKDSWERYQKERNALLEEMKFN